MTPYTPPEPAIHIPFGSYQVKFEIDNAVPMFTEAQLRSEVERVRRETIEECAEAIDDACREQIMTASDCIDLIRNIK